MLQRRSDLPLDRDALSHFLPWLIAFMVYLAVLALAGVLILSAMAQRWDRGLTGTLTVQITPPEDGGPDSSRLNAALLILRATPGVRRADPVSDADIRELLDPWLGSAADVGNLPLPSLIDVELEPGATLDVQQLADRLAGSVPGVSVDDHRVWLDRLVNLIRTVEVIASVVLALIVLAMVGTVVFTTRTALAVHQEAIEVLHLIGARDSYIAGQLAGRAAGLGLKGGLFGMVLAVPTLIAIGWLAGRVEAGLLPAVTLAAWHWGVLAMMPLVAAVIAMLTARFTVLRTLGRMP